jgi:uncharacterized protein involved in exopolysaccharide biosynthesis
MIRDAVEELVRRWRVLVAFPLAVGVLAVALSFLFHPRYEATAVFGPTAEASSVIPSSLASIAAQFGVNVPSSGYSVYYYSQVLQSRAVLERVVNDTLDADGQRVPVLTMLDPWGSTPAKRFESGVLTLQERMDVSTDDQADLVTVSSRAPSTRLAMALVQSILNALDSVMSASQRTGGSYERRFAQGQADSARDALRTAENQLRDFYQANRSIESSPALQVEEARLRRQIQIYQEVYLALVQQTETAKLQEARNTPSISLVQAPLASAKKVFPRRAVWGLFGCIGAVLLASSWLYVIVPAMAASSLRTRPGLWSRVLNA